MNEMKDNDKPMNMYELLKNGASEEKLTAAINTAAQNVINKYNAELAAAKARLDDERKAAIAAKEKEVAEAQTKELLAEARAYLINSLLAYNEVFQVVPAEELTDEAIESLEKEIIDLEGQIKYTLDLMKKLDLDNFDIEKLFGKFFG